jgi:hypothetical protein
MKDLVKNSVKVLIDYSMALLIFVVFIYVYISISGEKYYNTYLPLYCLVMFVLAALIIYSDMKKLAQKEKRPQYELNPYPLKGLVYGLLGFSPIILLEVVGAIIVLPTEFAERIKHLLINTLMGPPYFIIRLTGEAVWGYALASLTIPVLAMLGYLAGFYGIELSRKKKKQLAQPASTFAKSPWNPSNNTGRPAGSANGTAKPRKPKAPESQKPM